MLEFDYLFLESRLQTDLCLRCLGTPFLIVRCYLMKYAQEAAACNLPHPRKMFLALSYAFFYHVGGILLDKGKTVPETHQIHRPDSRICGHSTRERYHLWKVGRKLKKSRTLFTSRTYAFPGLPHRSFVRSHLSQGHFLMHLVLRCRYPPISSVLLPLEYHPVISYYPSRYPEFTYRKSVVWAFGSFSEQRLSPSWW